MYLANYLNKLIKEDGFILLDANSKEHVIGNPKKQNPIKLKLLDKSLHYKLLLYPDLFLGEAYSNGSAVIENGNLTEFLDIAFKNVGRNETGKFSELLNKLRKTHPLKIKSSRIRVPNYQKVNVLARSYVRYRLNIL